MSIDYIGIGRPGQIGNIKKAGKTASGQEKARERGSGQDKVQFSSVLQDVNKAQQTRKGSSSERADRVAEIKAQVQSGSYQPDLNKVSSSLLQFLINNK